MRLTRAQRSVVYVMIAAFAVAIGIGLWPIHANVVRRPLVLVRQRLLPQRAQVEGRQPGAAQRAQRRRDRHGHAQAAVPEQGHQQPRLGAAGRGRSRLVVGVLVIALHAAARRTAPPLPSPPRCVSANADRSAPSHGGAFSRAPSSARPSAPAGRAAATGARARSTCVAYSSNARHFASKSCDTRGARRRRGESGLVQRAEAGGEHARDERVGKVAVPEPRNVTGARSRAASADA